MKGEANICLLVQRSEHSAQHIFGEMPVLQLFKMW